MVLTKSTKHDSHFYAPDFELPEPLTGGTVALSDVRGTKGTLVIFTCVHCPFAVHLKRGFADVAVRARSLGIGVVAISSNDAVSYPADGPGPMRELARTTFKGFPFLYDETQEIARSYGAVCTPDIFLFDARDQIFYHGQFDGSRPMNGKPVTGSSLLGAFDALVTGDRAIRNAEPSIGCSIKWKR